MNFFKKRKNIVIIICAITLILLTFIFASSKTSKIPFVTDSINAFVTPIETVVSKTVNGVRGFFSFMISAKDFEIENIALKEKITNLETKYRNSKSFMDENDRLKKLLELQESLPQYESIGAYAIKTSNNWVKGFTIGKGTNSGIELGDIVLCHNGLAGHITSLGKNWANVTSVTDASISIGARCIRTGDIGVIENRDILLKDNQCAMKYISPDATIKIGDIVETSGLGEKYPTAVALGKVKKITEDDNGVSKTAIIETFADYKNIKEVIVLLSKKD